MTNPMHYFNSMTDPRVDRSPVIWKKRLSPT